MEDYNSITNNNLVSIIIPMYNAEEFTSVMIESIIAQTYTNWELIIIDDGSTDNCINIARDFERKDKRIKLICRPNNIKKGASSCRNIGIQNSQGEFIIFLDADDYIAPYCLSQRVAFMQKHPDYDFAVFPMFAFKNELFDTPNLIWGYKQENNVFPNFIAGTIPFVVVTNIYRKNSILTKELFWDTNLKSLQDSIYNITSLLKDCKFGFSNLLPDYFYRIGVNNNSISKKLTSDKHFISRLYFYRKVTSINEQNYNPYFLILTNIHFKFLCSDKNTSHINKFLSSPFLKKYPVLKLKLYLIYYLMFYLKLTSFRFRDTILLLTTPIFEIRQRLHYKKTLSQKIHLYKELINKYSAEITVLKQIYSSNQ